MHYREAIQSLDNAHCFNKRKDKPKEEEWLIKTIDAVNNLLRNLR